uniref:Uncharacterized protein n=1 Tax=Clytia hemisphaerica TaxID=252671 RepID=A0A7M5WTI6_9CNID
MDPGKEKDTVKQIQKMINGGNDFRKEFDKNSRDDLGHHHEHEDIDVGGEDSKPNSDTGEHIPTVDNVLPKSYQDDERKMVQQSIMDQTNNIVDLFKNVQHGHGHHKSPEMAFLKQASRMTGAGPWSVTKSKIKRNLVAKKQNIEKNLSDVASKDIVSADYAEMERNAMDKHFSNEKQAVLSLYDNILDGKNDGRYAENTFVDRLMKLTNTPWGLSKRGGNHIKKTELSTATPLNHMSLKETKKHSIPEQDDNVEENGEDNEDSEELETDEKDQSIVQKQDQITNNLIYGVENKIKNMFAEVDPNKEYKDAQKRFDDITNKLADTTWGLTKKSNIKRRVKRDIDNAGTEENENKNEDQENDFNDSSEEEDTEHNQLVAKQDKITNNFIYGVENTIKGMFAEEDPNKEYKDAQKRFKDITDKLADTTWGLTRKSQIQGRKKRENEEESRFNSTDNMLPEGYVQEEHDKMNHNIEHEENDMQGLFDDVTHNTGNDEKAEDLFVHKMEKLAGTSWGLGKKQKVVNNLDVAQTVKKNVVSEEQNNESEDQTENETDEDSVDESGDIKHGQLIEKQDKITNNLIYGVENNIKNMFADEDPNKEYKDAQKRFDDITYKLADTSWGLDKKNKIVKPKSTSKHIKKKLNLKKGHGKKDFKNNSSRKRKGKSRQNKKHKPRKITKLIQKSKSRKIHQNKHLKKIGKKHHKKKHWSKHNSSKKHTTKKAKNYQQKKHKKWHKKISKHVQKHSKNKRKKYHGKKKHYSKKNKHKKQKHRLGLSSKRNRTFDHGDDFHEDHHMDHHAEEPKINYEKLVSTPNDHEQEHGLHEEAEKNDFHHEEHAHAEPEHVEDHHEEPHHHHHNDSNHGPEEGEKFHEQEHGDHEEPERYHDEPHEHNREDREYDDDDEDHPEEEERGPHETADASTVDHMLPKGYVGDEHHRLDDRIHHEESEMQHLFDHDVKHHDLGKHEDRAEDDFIDKMQKLTETPWGLQKKSKTMNTTLSLTNTTTHDPVPAERRTNLLRTVQDIPKLLLGKLSSTKLKNDTGDRRTLADRKQTIDNSLVSQPAPTKGVLNDFVTNSMNQQKGFYDNSLLADENGRKNSDLSGSDISLLKSSFNPEGQENQKGNHISLPHLNSTLEPGFGQINHQNRSLDDSPEDIGNPNDQTVTHISPEDDEDPISLTNEKEDKDSQVNHYMHDVKMEGEDPIADENYYGHKDFEHHETENHEREHQQHNVHMSQHEFDVNTEAHDHYHDTNEGKEHHKHNHGRHHEHAHNEKNHNEDAPSDQSDYDSLEQVPFASNRDSGKKHGIPDLVQSVLSKDASSVKFHGLNADPFSSAQNKQNFKQSLNAQQGEQNKLQLDVTSNDFGELSTPSEESSRNQEQTSEATRHDDIHDYHHEKGKHAHYGLNGQLLHFDSYNDHDRFDENENADYHEEDHRHKEIDHYGNKKADEAAMIAHGDGHQGMFGHEGKRKHSGEHHPEGEHHYKDTYKDTYKDNYNDHYNDHYSDNYSDNYQDTYKDTYKHPEKSAHHHGESSYKHLKHHPKEDNTWFKDHEHKEDFKHSRFKDGEHEDDGIHTKGYIGKHKEEQDAESRDTLSTGHHHEPILESHNHDTENGNSHRGGSESESLLNGWVGYTKDNPNPTYDARFIDSLIPKKLVNLENARIGHKVDRETKEIYNLFHDIKKHNVREPEQRLIGELSRLISSKWGLNGNLGYEVPYPHIPKGLTHKYRKIVVNLNTEGYPGGAVEEPPSPQKLQLHDNHLHHHHIHHHHHIDDEDDETGSRRTNLPSDAHSETNTKTFVNKSGDTTVVPGNSFLDDMASWEMPITKESFASQKEFENFATALKEDYDHIKNTASTVKRETISTRKSSLSKADY